MTKTKEMGINHRTMKQKLAEYRHQPLSLLLLALTLLAAVITVGVLLCLIAYILYKGIPNMHLSLFAWKYTTENSSMMPAIINTLLMTVITLIIAVPIGVFSAIYLVEYAKRGNKLVKVIRMTTETLQGIPSIVFGLFGFLMFVVACNFGFSLLGGAITLALMVLPLIMRATEEALLSVPDSFREGSFGLGAGRLRTIDLPHHPAQRNAGNPRRNHSGSGTYCGRNCRTDVHRRHCYHSMYRAVPLLPYPCCAYVPAAL